MNQKEKHLHGMCSTAFLRNLLSDNVDEIIISNTNLNFDKLRVLTNKIEFHHDVEFEFKFFDVELDELLRRDALRERSVGENVIKSFHNKYEDTVLKIKQFFKLKKIEINT